MFIVITDRINIFDYIFNIEWFNLVFHILRNDQWLSLFYDYLKMLIIVKIPCK